MLKKASLIPLLFISAPHLCTNLQTIMSEKPESSSSQNIEMKKTSHYDKKGRYKPQIEVSVGYKLMDVTNIDMRANTFDCHIRILLEWEDPEVAAMFANGEKEKDVDWRSKAYDPCIAIKNKMGELVEVEDTLKLDEPEKGGLKRIWEIMGTFSYEGRYHKFPFDSQMLPIRLKSYDKNQWPGQINWYLRHKVGNPVLKTCRQLEYDLLEPQFTQTQSDANESSKGKQYNEANILIPIERASMYYLTNIYFTSFLVTTLSCAAFAIPPDSVGDRMGIVLTMFLTFVALKFVIADTLPAIPYNTSVDWFLLCNFMILYAVALENWLIVYYVERDAEAASDFDDAFLYITLGACGFINLFFLVQGSLFRTSVAPVLLERVS